MKRILLPVLLSLFILALPEQTIAQTTTETSKVNFEDYGICVEKATVKSAWPHSKHGPTLYYKGDVLVGKINYVDGVKNGDCIYYFYEGCTGKLREVQTFINDERQKVTIYSCDEESNSSIKRKEIIYDFKPGYDYTVLYYNLADLKKYHDDLPFGMGWSLYWFNVMYDCIKAYNLTGYVDIAKCVNLEELNNFGKHDFVYYTTDGKIASDSILRYKSGAVALQITRESRYPTKDGTTVKVYDKTGKLIGWEIDGKPNIYSNGQVVESGDTTFFENGKIKMLGKNLSYYENGNIKHHGDTTFYENGRIASIGNEIFYYSNGKIKSQLDGNQLLSYDSMGVKKCEKNIKTGEIKTYWPGGQVKSTGKHKIFSYNEKINMTTQINDNRYTDSTKLINLVPYDRDVKDLTINGDKYCGVTYLNYYKAKERNCTPAINTYLIEGGNFYDPVADTTYNRLTTNDITRLLEIMKKDTTNLYVQWAPTSYTCGVLLISYNKPLMDGLWLYYDEKGSLTSAKNYLWGKELPLPDSIQAQLIEAEQERLYRASFEEQKKNIAQKTADFEKKYESQPKYSNLYTKGKQLLTEYSNSIDNEKLLQKKIEIGETQIIPLLDRMIYLADQDSKSLNKKIKKAGSSDEIKALLGL